ncbi:MAG: hypothetical protein H7Z14_13590 [Anaerolineae bacterium]|nr:hypothetical protein [Phycisphaerae bacterium]
MNASVSEQDLELLETYLDNELLGDEMNQVRARLKNEPALAIALEQLTRDRQLRHQVFFAMDREGAATARATSDSIGRSLNQAAVREVAWGNRRQILRHACAAAACIVVGLLVGWFGRERAENRFANQTNRNTASQVGDATAVPDANEVAEGGFTVGITDDRGRVLAQQRFATLNEARQFSSDLLRWQTRQREMRSGDVRLVRDGF